MIFFAPKLQKAGNPKIIIITTTKKSAIYIKMIRRELSSHQNKYFLMFCSKGLLFLELHCEYIDISIQNNYTVNILAPVLVLQKW